jgi:RNA polymerase sigma-70 factor (ECF subfamily)
MPETVTTGDMTPEEDAFRHVVAHRTMLAAYIRAIVRDSALAEDALSDASVELVRHWPDYDRARPFGPWARGVARRVALASLRRRRNAPVPLDDDTLEAVGAELDDIARESAVETRKRLLKLCLERLPEPHRRLVRLRHFEDRTYDDIARTLNRPVDALYVAFSRIHRSLRDCIEKHREES